MSAWSRTRTFVVDETAVEFPLPTRDALLARVPDAHPRLFLEERFSQLRKDPLDLFHTTALEALKRGLGRTPGATQRLWALLILDSWVRLIRAT